MAPKNPVLISSIGYKKAIVRHCTDHLREIEGRLEFAIGPRWEHMLNGCEDLISVGKLIIALQRRTELRGAESVLIEELLQLSSAEADERAINIILNIKKRLRELCRAVPYPVDPAHLLGAAVVRGSDNISGPCRGRVVEHDPLVGFRVLYSDGDTEDLPMRDLQSIIIRGQAAQTIAVDGGSAAGIPVLRIREPAPDIDPAGVYGTRGSSGSRAVGTRLWSCGGRIIKGGAWKGNEDPTVQKLFNQLAERHGNEILSRSAALPSTQTDHPKSKGGKRSVIHRLPLAVSEGGVDRANPELLAKAAELPNGWLWESVSGRVKFTSPDGLTTVTSVAKAHSWHQKQLKLLNAHFHQAETKRRKTSDGDKVSPCTPPAITDVPTIVPKALAGVVSSMESGTVAAAEVATRSSVPEFGLSIVEVEAAALRPGRKRLPRELRGLAIPDRDWNVAMPFFDTSSKTREQASSSVETQAAAAAAREMHQRRVEERQAV